MLHCGSQGICVAMIANSPGSPSYALRASDGQPGAFGNLTMPMASESRRTTSSSIDAQNPGLPLLAILAILSDYIQVNADSVVLLHYILLHHPIHIDRNDLFVPALKIGHPTRNTAFFKKLRNHSLRLAVKSTVNNFFFSGR